MTVELSFVEAGSGRPVVLLHAFPLHREIFAEQLAALAGRARVITPDLRGFGASPGPGDEPPSIDVLADDVVALLDRLGIDSCILGGLSLGGYVTMNILRRFPERVSGAILMDTKGGADDDEARATRARIAAAVLEQGTRALRPMLDGLLGETTRRDRPEVVRRVTGWLDGASPASVAWAQKAMAERPSSLDVFAEVTVPSFVVVGEQDTISPHDEALAIAQAFEPPVPVYVIPEAGHLSSVENPESVTGALRDALRHM